MTWKTTMDKLIIRLLLSYIFVISCFWCWQRLTYLYSIYSMTPKSLSASASKWSCTMKIMCHLQLIPSNHSLSVHANQQDSQSGYAGESSSDNSWLISQKYIFDCFSTIFTCRKLRTNQMGVKKYLATLLLPQVCKSWPYYFGKFSQMNRSGYIRHLLVQAQSFWPIRTHSSSAFCLRSPMPKDCKLRLLRLHRNHYNGREWFITFSYDTLL